MKPADFPSLLVATCTLWMTSCAAPPNLPAGDNTCREPRLVEVLEFIDGDTADVVFVDPVSLEPLDDPEERIRLIGVDTPELSGSECYAVDAWDEAAEQLGSKLAWLSYDEQCQDFFGRTLAYMSRRSDLFFLNEYLVEHGFGRVLSIPPSDHFREEFAALELAAQEQARGLWGEPCYGTTR